MGCRSRERRLGWALEALLLWPATTKRAGPGRQEPKHQSAGLPEPPWPHAEPSVVVAKATRGFER